MPLLECDLYEVMQACVRGSLREVRVQFSKESALGIVLASEGYPSAITKMAVPISSGWQWREGGWWFAVVVLWHHHCASTAVFIP